jgi:hypothetical protein
MNATDPRAEAFPDTEFTPRGVDLPSAAPARRVRGGQRKRIVRSEYLRSESLAPARRCALVDQLYEIYNATLYGQTRDEFGAQVFGAGEVRFALFYGASGELAGYSYAGIERIDHEGRTHAVFSAGGFFRPGYHGGLASILFGLRQAARAKLRHPRTPLAYLTRCATPATYRLLASTMPRIYPSRRYRTPADIEALVRALNARRRYGAVGADPWIVRTTIWLHDPSRLRRLEHDPDVRFYTELNPRFAEGEALLAWTPLDLANIAGGFLRTLRAHLTR